MRRIDYYNSFQLASVGINQPELGWILHASSASCPWDNTASKQWICLSYKNCTSPFMTGMQNAVMILMKKQRWNPELWEVGQNQRIKYFLATYPTILYSYNSVYTCFCIGLNVLPSYSHDSVGIFLHTTVSDHNILMTVYA